MRFSPRSAAVAACLVVPVALVAQLFGQAGPPVGGPPVRPAAPAATAGVHTHVVVIDVAFIYKNHNRFNATMLDIKTDIEQFEAYVRKKQGEFKTLGEALGTYAPNSNEYKKKEEELARLQSDLQIEVGLKRKEFLQQEARVYYRVYKEIEAEVKNVAERNGIHLVLRFNREDDMKEEDRASVLQGVNRAVVYNSRDRDITEYVLVRLNAGTTKPPTTPGGAGPAGQTSKRPGPVVPGGTQPR